MKKNSRVQHAQVWAVQGWVPSWDEGCWGEKNSSVMGAQAWAVLGWVIIYLGW